MMQPFILGQRHGAELDLEEGFEEPGCLLGFWEAVKIREIHCRPTLLYIPDDELVCGLRPIEPGQPGLIGMAVITGSPEDLLYGGRSGEIGGDGWIVQPGSYAL